jgi:hypothetical protein
MIMPQANAILPALSTGFGCRRIARALANTRNIVAAAVVFSSLPDAKMSKIQWP